MTLQRIDFNHFFIETQDHIQHRHQVLINPNVMAFYKCGPVYLALTTNAAEKALVVNFAINTGKKENEIWVDQLVKDCKINGYEKVVFITDNPIVENIAKKYNCKLVKTLEKFYDDGTDAKVFEGCPQEF